MTTRQDNRPTKRAKRQPPARRLVGLKSISPLEDLPNNWYNRTLTPFLSKTQPRSRDKLAASRSAMSSPSFGCRTVFGAVLAAGPVPWRETLRRANTLVAKTRIGTVQYIMSPPSACYPQTLLLSLSLTLRSCPSPPPQSSRTSPPTSCARPGPHPRPTPR